MTVRRGDRAIGAAAQGISLDATMDSLRAQMMARWDAVVVGESAAERDEAVRAAAHPWLLCLDAGDTADPGLLARVRDSLLAGPSLDAVHYGWSVIDDDGVPVAEAQCDTAGDLFDLLARRLAFPTGACVVRRALVEEAGGFGGAPLAAADWILWQRIARRGARFGRIARTLVTFPPHASWSPAEAETRFAGAVAAIGLGHAEDPAARLAPGAPYFDGRLARADEPLVDALCSIGADVIAHEGDATPLVGLLPPGRRIVDVESAADAMVSDSTIAMRPAGPSLALRWNPTRDGLPAFLRAIESRVERPQLSRDLLRQVQRLILPHLALPLPPAVEGTHLDVAEITRPIADIATAASATIGQLRIHFEDVVLGVIELPVEGGLLAARVVRDAIATRFAWVVLGRLFERTVYAGLEYRREGTGWSAWRGEHRLAGGLPDEERARRRALHDAIGWETFVAELWEADPPRLAQLADAVERVAARLRGDDDGRHRGVPRPMRVAVAAPVPWFRFGARNIAAELVVRSATTTTSVTTVEVVVGVVGIVGIVSGRRLRAVLAAAAGVDLCRVVVREALLGAPLAGESLRERLYGRSPHPSGADSAGGSTSRGARRPPRSSDPR